MTTVSCDIAAYAGGLARKVAARAVLLYADAIADDEELRQILRGLDHRTLLVTRARHERELPTNDGCTWVTVPDVYLSRGAQLKSALLVCLARQVLQHGDRVLFIGGADGSGALDTVLVFNVGMLPELFSLADATAFAGEVIPEVFERVLLLATQLAVEGREGRPVGTLFVVGDSERVLSQSRSLVLNPFQGHPESQRNILNPCLDETIKEFSALDGAFIVREDGVVLSAGSQLVPSVAHSDLPGGLGTRHAAAAGITASTSAVAVCVSQSTGTVSLYRSGELVTSIPRPVYGVRLAG
ncbi:MAG TPA: diadenylate cyclase [Gemmataceae bacterium]|nr:diadenylate cyclase [Gemmataceae bacterium]